MYPATNKPANAKPMANRIACGRGEGFAAFLPEVRRADLLIFLMLV